MLQFANQSKVILVPGVSGSGKSTFVIRYLLNGKFTCRFIFDARGEYAERLKKIPARRPAELQAAILTRWVIYDPHMLFPGDVNRAFECFCEWVFSTCGQMAGQKMMFVDEVWRHCSPNKIPLALATIVQDGRKNGLGLITASQRPNRINEAILNEAREIVCFRLQGSNALKKIVELDEGFSTGELASLPNLRYVARNLDSGGERRGILTF